LPSRGTILGNAYPELTASLEKTHQLYRSPYPHGQGIVDGLHYWGVLNNLLQNSKAG
jgi:hypothetical protein